MHTSRIEDFKIRIEKFESASESTQDSIPVSLKIRATSGCYSRGCCPNAYRIIDKNLRLLRNEKSFAYEEQESGPEILVLLEFKTTGISLAKSILELITTIIKARFEGQKKGDYHREPIELIIRRFDENRNYVEDRILQINAESDYTAKEVEEKINNSILKITQRLNNIYIEYLKAEMVKLGWSIPTLKLAIRAKFKCEYCDGDIFKSVDSYYDIQVDHIKPKKKGGTDDPENLAITCKNCNFIKKYYDPYVEFTDSQPTREQLINAAKEWIQNKKDAKMKDIIKMKNISQIISSNNKYNRAIKRNLFELERAISYRNGVNQLARVATVTEWSFFSYSSLAMYDGIFFHLMKILDEHKDAASFWYIWRCNQKDVEKFLLNRNLTISEIQDFSNKLKQIRDKTHFHIDKSDIFSPINVWKRADITGNYLNRIIDNLWLVLNDLYCKQYGEPFEQPIYEGEDIEKIIQAVRERNIVI